MEFNEKLQALRQQKRLTQEELASSLYVSRTAISKWESGRGYPNLESLKDIAKFFKVTIDELLSKDELLILAEENSQQKEKYFRGLIFGLLDCCAALLLFLPFFAERSDGVIRSVSLISLDGTPIYLKAIYFSAVIVMISIGIITLALQGCQNPKFIKIKQTGSLSLGAILVMLFMISLQPYAAVFAFSLLTVKSLILIKLS